VSRAPDVVVVGAGLARPTLALACARLGARAPLFEAAEDDLHASAGNFGLAWVQGEGVDAPDDPALAEETGVSPGCRRTGGVGNALSEDGLDARAAEIRGRRNQPPPGANPAFSADNFGTNRFGTNRIGGAA
jgi:glycine/D-amino acid oxidase-like deaminating enzyme